MAMTTDEAIASLNATNETLGKVSGETDALLKEIERLNAALEAAGGAGGTITPELEAAIQAVDTRAKEIDNLVADVEPTPPETPPA
jgi:ABC-type transporter Mla subunit MlaD